MTISSAQVERLFHLFEVAFHAFDPLITCIKLAIDTLEASIGVALLFAKPFTLSQTILYAVKMAFIHRHSGSRPDTA
jgi:hypothetical protein